MVSSRTLARSPLASPGIWYWPDTHAPICQRPPAAGDHRPRDHDARTADHRQRRREGLGGVEHARAQPVAPGRRGFGAGWCGHDGRRCRRGRGRRRRGRQQALRLRARDPGAIVLEHRRQRQIDHLGQRRQIQLVEPARQIDVADQEARAGSAHEVKMRAARVAEIDPASRGRARAGVGRGVEDLRRAKRLETPPANRSARCPASDAPARARAPDRPRCRRRRSRSRRRSCSRSRRPAAARPLPPAARPRSRRAGQRRSPRPRAASLELGQAAARQRAVGAVGVARRAAAARMRAPRLAHRAAPALARVRRAPRAPARHPPRRPGSDRTRRAPRAATRDRAASVRVERRRPAPPMKRETPFAAGDRARSPAGRGRRSSRRAPGAGARRRSRGSRAARAANESAAARTSRPAGAGARHGRRLGCRWQRSATGPPVFAPAHGGVTRPRACEREPMARTGAQSAAATTRPSRSPSRR